jgi:hypothetical protein
MSFRERGEQRWLACWTTYLPSNKALRFVIFHSSILFIRSTHVTSSSRSMSAPDLNERARRRPYSDSDSLKTASDEEDEEAPPFGYMPEAVGEEVAAVAIVVVWRELV